MGRIFSLRGKLSTFDNSIAANHNVFDYVSEDRTRAWKVIEAYVWPVNYKGPDIIADGFFLLTAALATDSGKFNPDDILDPTENRMFGWAMQNYNQRDGPTPFITPNGFPLNQARFLIDPDTLITKQLFINIATTTDEDEANVREWGWMIILEEQKVTPAQSLFQQIKGVGQDIDSGGF